MIKFCAIVSGGLCSSLKGIENADFIIACDKGYEYLKINHLVPDLVVGDFDSCIEKIQENIPKIEFPKNKYDTDTMCAIKYAVSNGFTDVVLYCALGKRLDHTIANLQACVWSSEKVNIKIFDENNEIYFVNNSKVSIPKKDGYSLSVFSAVDVCKNVSIKNTKYVLDNFTLTNYYPLGVSNEWIDDAEISVESGVLMIVLSKL